ncbi:MAG: DUF47 family protein [Deltaproteobacteria bacterium]|nr:DUF47 family protein [Deltaproteobacteria bacterium]
MAPFFWSKSKSVEEMIENYMLSVDECIQSCSNGIEDYITNGCTDTFITLNKKTHQAESRADDIRREIEFKLYGKALLPESRGDLLGMLESIDNIPGAAEGSINIFYLERPEITEFVKKIIPDLLEVNLEAYSLIRKAVDAILNNPRETLYIDKEIDSRESKADTMQQDIVLSIFKSDLELAHKNQLKAIISSINRISDRCQDSADRMSIIAIKRRI